jgi:hypothetical protein
MGGHRGQAVALMKTLTTPRQDLPMWPTDKYPIELQLRVTTFLALALLGIVVVAREAVSRILAGPVRFGLPPASLAGPPHRILSTARGAFLLMVLFITLTVPYWMGNAFSPAGFCFLYIWFSIYNQPRLSRRDVHRWLVLASGSLTLVTGAMLLVRGSGIIQLGVNSEFGLFRALMFVYAFVFFAFGAAAIQESISGTRVRERGIEMFSWTRPWSRVVVKDWQAREGGFALHLSILPPQGFLAMPLTRGAEIIVPVPASVRPALEVFLAGHTATAG